MNGVLLPSGRWLNLALVVSIDFGAEAVTVAATASYSADGTSADSVLRLAELWLPSGDIDALWAYLNKTTTDLRTLKPAITPE